MTNKLPVVGRKYLSKGDKYVSLTVKEITEAVIYDIEWCGRTESVTDSSLVRYFWDYYEELPEDKVETKPTVEENLQVELSPEVKEAMRELKQEQLRVLPTSGFYNSGVRWHSCYNDLRDRAENLLNALDKQFKVNETSESVDVKEEEVKEKEEEFFYAAAGKLIEYQGKKYICINQTTYLPNERAEDWKEEDHTSQWYKHTKIKFRDIFANNKTQAKEVADNEIEAYRLGTSSEELRILKEYEERFGKFHPAQDLKSCIKIALKWHASAVDNKIQPDENGSFKHIDGAEEETQDLMKKDIFGSGKKQVESEKKIEEETYQALSIQNRASIWRDVSELPRFEKERGQPDLLIRFDDGNVRFGTFNGFFSDVKGYAFKQRYVKQYCLLEAFVSDYEKLKERDKQKEIRLSKLEERVKKLEINS